MSPANETAISATNTGTITSAAVVSRFVLAATAQAVFTDAAAAGTLKLQGSNDATSPTHWNDIANATTTVVAGATATTPLLAANLCYQWIRVVWTSSAGAGTVTVNLHTVGA